MTVEGLDRLQRKLTRIIPDKAKAAARRALEQSADEMVAMMKRLVPVDSGDLRDSIGWTWGKKPIYSQAIAKVKSAGSGDMVITIYAGNYGVRYAHLVEFGSARHIIKAKRAKALGKDGRLGIEVHHPGGKAQPFFFPSYRALRRSARARVSRAISKAIKDGAK